MAFSVCAVERPILGMRKSTVSLKLDPPVTNPFYLTLNVVFECISHSRNMGNMNEISEVPD